MGRTDRPPPSPRGSVLAVVALALGLRLLRLPARWTGTAWLYAAYPSDTVDALRAGDLDGALAFTGLHPPGWPLLHALSELLLPVPLLWLSLSVLASTAAVAQVARRSLLAGVLLATSPLQLAYAAEVNDYPLAVALVAACLVLRGRGRWWVLALVGAAAAWVHVLAGLAAGLVALTVRERGRVLALMFLACLPLLPGALDLLGRADTFRQPPLRPDLVAADVLERFGLLWLGLVPAWLLGLRRLPWLLLPTAGLGLMILGLQLAGIAAPHQFPYWLLLGPGLALAAAAAPPPLRVLAVLVALAHGGLATWHGGARLQQLADPRPRAVDVALAELDTPWTCADLLAGDATPACTGDALYLLLSRPADDDDKRPLAPSLWRLPPWRSMPRVRPYAFDWGDFRHGQPRRVSVEGAPHVVYVEDWVREEVAEAAAAHPRLWLVLTERQADHPDAVAISEVLGVTPVPVGPDLLYRVP